MASFSWPRFRLWEESDPILLLAGAESERLLARVRLIVCGLLLITPTYKLIRHPDVPIYVMGFWVTLAGTIGAVAISWQLRRSTYRPWLGFLSSALDVSLISLALALFLVFDSPLTALNSKVTFEIYFLALTAAALRYDRRICLSAGLLAMGEYTALLLWSATRWNLEAEALLRSTLGSFSAVDQVTRLILLGAAVLLSLHLVGRAKRLLVLSNRDPVTGVGNRHFFEASAAGEVARAFRHGRLCAIVVMDVDRFKQFNDSHGHTVGDRVLRVVAGILGAQTRATDVVARWGGEEFALVLPEASREDARKRMEEIRRTVAQTELDVPNARGPRHLTVSIGIASMPEDGHDLSTLFAIADTRMLVAKQRGRDQVIAAATQEEFDEGALHAMGRTTPQSG